MTYVGKIKCVKIRVFIKTKYIKRFLICGFLTTLCCWYTQCVVRVFVCVCVCVCMCVCYYSVSHEKRVKELNHQLSYLTQQRDSNTQEIAELKVQMKMIEDCRDAAKRDLVDAADNIRRGKNCYSSPSGLLPAPSNGENTSPFRATCKSAF